MLIQKIYVISIIFINLLTTDTIHMYILLYLQH